MSKRSFLGSGTTGTSPMMESHTSENSFTFLLRLYQLLFADKPGLKQLGHDLKVQTNPAALPLVTLPTVRLTGVVLPLVWNLKEVLAQTSSLNLGLVMVVAAVDLQVQLSNEKFNQDHC